MRIAGRLLAILTIAALLAPGVRWAAVQGGGEACACPPAACRCPGHHHAFGHAAMCGIANGGQCGLDSPDSVINSLLGNLIFVPTEHCLSNPLKLWAPQQAAPSSSLLRSHPRPLDHPPRPAL